MKLARILILVSLLVFPAQIATANPGAIYAATSNGVFKSIDGGGSWIAANSGLGLISVFSLAVDPSKPATLYAGTLGKGVYKSIDGGQSWIAANSGLELISVLSLAIDPSNPSTIYAGTAGPMFFPSEGVFKSIDGGLSWTVSNSGLPHAIITVLAIDPLNPVIIYAGTNFAGVFKSTDGGQNWTAANAGMTSADVAALVIDPANSTTLYAGIEGCSSNCANPAGVFKSTNGATNWSSVNSGITDLQVISLAVDPSNGNVLYAGTRLDGVFKSVDAGANWSLVNPGLQSTLFATLHLPLIIDPSNPGTVYAGTDNGVFKSTDGGMSWTDANTGFPATNPTSVFALTIEPVAPPTIASLIAQIGSLELNSGVKNSLIAKLLAAQKSLARGNDIAAGNQLKAFINHVRALERSGRLDRATASSLVQAAQAIIDGL
jgi:photosystem II stability/assembly factor-like uncharacterized protein